MRQGRGGPPALGRVGRLTSSAQRGTRSWRHDCAVEMAQTEAAEGRNSGALEMAESIRDSQSAEIAEIAEMEQLLAELGG